MSIRFASRAFQRPSLQSSSFSSPRAKTALAAVAIIAAAIASAAPARAQTMSYRALGYADPSQESLAPGGRLPDVLDDEQLPAAALPDRLKRTIVAFNTREAPGTIIIDTRNTQLYYVLGNGRAIRYGVGVGREGFTWSGVKTIARKAEWPDWHPPAAMIARQPYLPRFMAGGPGNPLGAAAMYLGSSDYRIHGTNDPSTIGKFVSSGCIRLTNEDVRDLYSRVRIGAKVIVLPKSGSQQFEANARRPERNASVTTSAQSLHQVARLSRLN